MYGSCPVELAADQIETRERPCARADSIAAGTITSRTVLQNGASRNHEVSFVVMSSMMRSRSAGPAKRAFW